MPLYDFKCEGCGKTYETLTKETVNAIECFFCGDRAHRLLSKPNVKVKGFSADNGYSRDG